MALHSDDVYFPGPVTPLTDAQKERIKRQEQERKALRAEKEAAHLAEISAIDLANARISAYIDCDGTFSSWKINSTYLSGNMNPIFRDWEGYDLVLGYCVQWAKAHPKQFLENCLKDSPNTRNRVKMYGVSKL